MSNISVSSRPRLAAVNSAKQVLTLSAPSACSVVIKIWFSWPSKSSQITSSVVVSGSDCSVNVSADRDICQAKI